LDRDPAPADGGGAAEVPAAAAEPGPTDALGAADRRAAAGVPAAAAAPYRLGPVEAARAWDELGCPYEAATGCTSR
jgi:hypothetical protein